MSQPTDEELRELVKTSSSMNEVSKKCGYLSKNKKINKRIREMDLDISHFNLKKFEKLSNIEFVNIIKESKSYRDALLKCGYKTDTIPESFKNKIIELKIDTSHFKIKEMDKVNDIEFEEIITNSKSYKEILKRLGYSEKSSGQTLHDIVKRINNLEIDTKHLNFSKSEQISNDNLKDIVKSCNNFLEVTLKLGYKKGSNGDVKKFITKMNIDTSHFFYSRFLNFSDEEFEDIVYSSKQYKEIYEKLGYNENTDILIRNKIKKRIKDLNLCEDHLGLRKDYSLNRNAFQKMTRDYAWVLGLIYSDGSINEENNVTLELTDLNILEQTEKILEGKNLITKMPKRKGLEHHKQSWLLRFASKKISKQLKETYGLFPNKSLSVEWPEKLEQEYYWDFIRGVFDGDGCFYTRRRKRTQEGSFYIYSASNKFSTQLREKLELLGVKSVKIGHKRKLGYNNMYVVSIYNYKDLSFIYNFLYKDTISYLPRKKEKYKYYLEKRNSKNIKTVI